MRAIYILSILLIITLNGCATVEIAKEVTKVGDSIKTTIQKAAKKQNDFEKTEDVTKEKEEIVVAKKKEEAVINKQKEIAIIKIKGIQLQLLCSPTALNTPFGLKNISLHAWKGFDTLCIPCSLYFCCSNTV